MGYSLLSPTVQFAVVQVSGSCLDNQNKGLAAAGIGVFFGPDPKCNLSEPLHVGRQTNNRAVLIAAYRAMRKAKSMHIENLIVQSNSRYLVDNMNDSIHFWRRNNFTGCSGRPVANGDDFRRIDNQMQNFRFVLFEYIEKDENAQAHSLAVKGASMKKRILSMNGEE